MAGLHPGGGKAVSGDSSLLPQPCRPQVAFRGHGWVCAEQGGLCSLEE